MATSLDIVIVNWNAGEQLRRGVESIAFASCEGVELQRVVVVDNASRDGSADGLDAGGIPLQVVRNRANRGFAAACNQGAARSRADYLLFQNPDVVLYEDSLHSPVRFMERPENARVGVVGIRLIGDDGAADRCCARFPTPAMFLMELLGLTYLFPRAVPNLQMVEWDHSESREVDHVKGAFFLVRRTVFEALGGFDERFFVYLEDLDFSLRCVRAGWPNYYLADAAAYHRGRGTTDQVRAARLFYNLKSRILYSYKHFSWWTASGLALGTFVVEPVLRLAFALVRLSAAEIRQTAAGYRMLWADLPALVRFARNGGPELQSSHCKVSSAK